MNTVAVVGNDSHHRYHDPDAVRLFLQFIKRTNPKKVILLGDIIDFYAISRYSKDPDRATPTSFKEELYIVRQFLYNVRKALGKGEIVYIQGNHEKRLQTYLWNNSAALSELDELKLPSLLRLDAYDIRYVPDGTWLGDIYFTHGSIVRKHAGYSAKAEFEKNGCTGMTGHTHRDGKYTVRNRSGHFAWWENFCLCDLNPEYIEGIANWTNGFSCINIINDRPYVEQIPIMGTPKSYIYGGKVYS